MTPRLTIAALVGLLGLIWAEPALAQAAGPEYDMTAATIKMIGVLAVILGLLVGGVWLMKRWLPGGAARFGGLGGGRIKILVSQPLGPKKQLSLIQTAGRVFLIGVSDQSINLIAEIDDPDQVAQLQTGSAEGAAKPNFGSLLKKFSGGGRP